MPRHGIGRAMKVSKEQLVALMTALKLFASGDYDAEPKRLLSHLVTVAAALEGRPVR